MGLKIGEHLQIQITYKILWLGFPKHSFFKDFQLAFKGGCFLVVFIKYIVDPSLLLGKTASKQHLSNARWITQIWELFGHMEP